MLPILKEMFCEKLDVVVVGSFMTDVVRYGCVNNLLQLSEKLAMTTLTLF